MADNNKSKRKEFREGFTGMGQNMVTGISNLIAGKPYSENNTDAKELLFGTQEKSQGINADSLSANKPTLNQIVAGRGTSTAQPDISTPQNLLGNNVSGGQTDIEMDTTLNDIVPENPLSASNILGNTGIKESEKVMQAEEEVKNENSGKTISNFFKSIGDTISDWNLANILDTKRQAKEKVVAVGYNPDNHDVLRLSFNEGQGIWDDFRDTFFKRGQGNQQVFDALYNEYRDELSTIASSNYDNATKYQMADAAYDKFLNEVNDRRLLKVYADDYYSDGLIYGIFDNEAKAKGRRMDQFSQEQLDRLAQSDIKEPGVYKVTSDQLDAFLDAYGYNGYSENSAERYAMTDSTETAKVRYELEDEGLVQLKSVETHQVIDPAMAQIKALISDGVITPQVGNEILANSYGVVESALNQMHLYLDEPLAYYKAVQSKDYGDLTTGEKAILGYGDGIMQFMDDYTAALQKWLQESISGGIENGELVSPAEIIDGMSITDFFKDAISDANIKAGGLDLLATESAIDAMQHINNNINYLYWQGKGSGLRRTWTEAQRIGGGYGYLAGELFQLGIMGWVKGIEALSGKDIQDVADYDLADFTTGRLITTDEGDWGGLLKQYGLAALENVPEFAGEYEAIRPFLGGTNKYAKLSRKMLELEKGAAASRKMGLFSKIFNNARKTVGSVANAGGTKNWISKMYEGVANKIPAKLRAVLELGNNAIKRTVRDQAIDAIASYYDTESYSTPSFMLSVGFTGLTEILPSILGDTQLYKMVKNKIKGLNRTDGTGWRLMDIISSDEDLLKRWSDIYGTDFNTYRLIAGSEGWGEVEDLMKQAYNMLSPDGKTAINNFTKEQMLEQLKKLGTIDWQSTYGRNLMSLINAKGSNIADVWKYILGIPGQLEFSGFTSSILFKEGVERQTRYLKQAYDIELDKISGQFRRGLENGFTKEQIEELASKTKYTDVIDNGKVNSKYFEKDGDKYILNSDGANYLKLQVTEYTDAMRRADVLRAQAEGTEDFLNETFSKIASGKGVSPEVIKRLASSGAYQKMVNEFSKVVC